MRKLYTRYFSIVLLVLSSVILLVSSIPTYSASTSGDCIQDTNSIPEAVQCLQAQIDYLKTENEQLTEIKEGVHIIEEGGAFTVAIDGTDVFQVSRTLSEHPDHQGVYEHGFKLLTPDGSTEEIGRSEISGGVRLIGDHRHAEMGIGPSPSFHSTFPSANDNRHLYFTLGDTWNNRRTGVTKRDFVIHSWNNDFTQHVQHLILKPNGIVKARAFNTGDLLFEKGGDILWRMFEDDNGLYVEQMQTGKKFRFALQEIDEE